MELEEEVQFALTPFKTSHFGKFANYFRFSWLHVLDNLCRSIKLSVFKGKIKIKNSVKFQELEPKIGEELCKREMQTIPVRVDVLQGQTIL